MELFIHTYIDSKAAEQFPMLLEKFLSKEKLKETFMKDTICEKHSKAHQGAKR